MQQNKIVSLERFPTQMECSPPIRQHKHKMRETLFLLQGLRETFGRESVGEGEERHGGKIERKRVWEVIYLSQTLWISLFSMWILHSRLKWLIAVLSQQGWVSKLMVRNHGKKRAIDLFAEVLSARHINCSQIEAVVCKKHYIYRWCVCVCVCVCVCIFDTCTWHHTKQVMDVLFEMRLNFQKRLVCILAEVE